MTQTVFGIPVADLALLVAGASFLVSLIAIGWQVIKHFLLDGGRVKVQLNPAVWEPGVKFMSNSNGLFPLADIYKRFDTYRALDYFELAQLIVENPGRIAVTILRPTLKVDGWTASGYTVSPRQFALPEMGENTATKATVVRIEPYDRVTFLFDVWPMVVETMGESGRALTIRGGIGLPGRRRLVLSKRRKAWHVPLGSWTFQEGLSEISPHTVMWRVAYRSLEGTVDQPNALPLSFLDQVISTAMSQFKTKPDPTSFANAIDHAIDLFGMKYYHFGYLASSMLTALDFEQDHLGGWTPGVKALGK